MGITSALVLFAVIWFLTLFIVLPIRIQTQGDKGEIVPGTHAGSPEVHHMRAKLRWTTLIAAVLWCIIAGIIVSGWITIEDIDWFNRMNTSPAS
jgi:predicted secreted protein